MRRACLVVRDAVRNCRHLGGSRARVPIALRCAVVRLCRRPTHVGCPRAFRPGLAEIELDAIALAQVVDALSVDGDGMKKYLLTAGIANKAEAFVCPELLIVPVIGHSLLCDFEGILWRCGARKRERSPVRATSRRRYVWLRGRDLNLRPLGYEPNELPDCSTPRQRNPIVTRQQRQDQCEQLVSKPASPMARVRPASH